MFIRVYKVKKVGLLSYEFLDELVINTSQIASIYEFTKNPVLNAKNSEKFQKIFDTTDLSVFQIELSTGKTFSIIGSTQKFKNIK